MATSFPKAWYPRKQRMCAKKEEVIAAYDLVMDFLSLPLLVMH